MIPYLKKRMTHKFGWMAMLPSGKTYNWYFKDMDHLTNITYNAKFYGFSVSPRSVQTEERNKSSIYP